ncbi:hypothetical protein FDF12_09855 [Clostridium botulinum]|uniref:hypothetical protein n=1 Tax=Clostridium sp. ZBS13 TaxID=2949971 RepID=UPI0013F0268B|nr:hypothetical protein [Clostridium sp. ZBS13]NFS28753.1 hypothetical protein [Clostridium botulinum]NFS55198.1 hypothetical protein [Clostridium botulinum]NFT17677.1 hypothetical protein [Clostridium botulinum]
MSYLSLAKRIINDELSDEELIKNLETPNVLVLQHVMLKLIKHNITSDFVCQKLIQYSDFMDIRFKILGLCKIGHLAIYSLKKLGYKKEYQDIYSRLEKQDQELVDMLEKAL